MREITLQIPEQNYAFFIEAIKSMSFIKKITDKKLKNKSAEDEPFKPRTKTELLADFKEALEEVRDIQSGKRPHGPTLEEFLNEL